MSRYFCFLLLVFVVGVNISHADLTPSYQLPTSVTGDGSEIDVCRNELGNPVTLYATVNNFSILGFDNAHFTRVSADMIEYKWIVDDTTISQGDSASFTINFGQNQFSRIGTYTVTCKARGVIDCFDSNGSPVQLTTLWFTVGEPVTINYFAVVFMYPMDNGKHKSIDSLTIVKGLNEVVMVRKIPEVSDTVYLTHDGIISVQGAGTVPANLLVSTNQNGIETIHNTVNGHIYAHFPNTSFPPVAELNVYVDSEMKVEIEIEP